ncbi:hypothetical protein TNCV_1025311 [Trichonephila clavipes]|nr:hypothetical protein TNCV_1025311 [Trichonephila clavipes]
MFVNRSPSVLIYKRMGGWLVHDVVRTCPETAFKYYNFSDYDRIDAESTTRRAPPPSLKPWRHQMAGNLTSILVRLGLTPLMWFLQLLIMVTGKYLANLLALFFYLEHVLDNINQFKISPENTANLDIINSLKYLKLIVHHRKKHLKIRNKFKFHPTLPTIEEVDETDQTPCNSPYFPPSTQPPNNIPPYPEPTTNNSAISTPRAIQSINLDPNFSNYSFLIPDVTVLLDSTPSNFNSPIPLYPTKNNRKPFKYIKRKFKNIKKKLLKKNN